jgi:hypothetical protein
MPTILDAVLVLVGGLLQIGGFVFLAMELERVRRDELRKPGRWDVVSAALRRQIRRILRLRPVGTTVEFRGAIDSMTLTDSARAVVSRAPAVLLEDKVRRLEWITGDLQRELRALEEEHRTSAGTLAQRLTETEQRLTQMAQHAEAARHRELEHKVSIESWSTLAFMLGTALGVLGSVL